MNNIHSKNKKIKDNIIVEGRDIDLGTCVSINLNLMFLGFKL